MKHLRDELIRPRSLIVVGGSNDLSRPGGAVLRNILTGGYSGNLYVLNPYEKEVQGLASYSDASSLPDTECAIFAVSAVKTIDTAQTLALHKNTRAFIVLSSGFSETGTEGKKLEDSLVAIVRNVKGTLIGPNCTGVILPGLAATFAGPVPELDPSGVDFVSASGAVACFTLERALPMGIRFSSIITVGNSPLCGVEEYVQYRDETFIESQSRVMLLYMEQVRNPALLIRHCSSMVRKGCRIAAVKAGTTDAGSRAAMSHTGALAGPDIAVEALFRKCGITRCTGREELVYTAGVMMHATPRGNNVAVITHAGGPGVLATDALVHAGLNVPVINKSASKKIADELFSGSSTSNPVDFLGTGTAEQLGKIIDITGNECPEIDSSVVIFGTPGLTDVTHVYDLLDEKMKTAVKPVFPVLPSTMIASKAVRHFTGLGRIFFSDEVMLAKALAAVINTPQPFYSDIRSPDNIDEIRMIIDAAKDGYLQPEYVRSILDLSGIPRVNELSVSRVDDVESSAASIGYPLAMKVTGISHKSDSGGVRLGIGSPAEAANAFVNLMKINGAEGVLIQQMAPGTELYIGGKRVEPYGHVLLCGLGGIFVEVLKDISAGIVPVSSGEALDMIRRLKGYDVIKGVRRLKAVCEETFAEIIVRVSSLLSSFPEIRELDINPLTGTGSSIQSVDCRILIGRNKF